MKNVKVLAMASLMGASAAIAGGDLWDFPNLHASTNNPYWGQVKVPGAIHCWTTAPEPDDENSYYSPCYEQTGGYWFGYGDLGGKARDANSDLDLTTTGALKTSVYCESKNSFCDGQGADQQRILYKGAGLGNATEGLHVKFALTGGTDTDPSLAGIGFNWRQKDNTDFENKKTENIQSKNGLCLVYKSSHDGVDVELGWNEASYEFNTWVVNLTASSSWKTVNLAWADFHISYGEESETSPLSVALTQAEALKIAYKNKDSAPIDVTFTLREIGWINTCGTPSSIKNVATVAGPQFNLAGRMLSVANISAPTQVQIINMHGSVVAQKTLGQNEPMNLANMPNGVYLVRSAKLGISQKIILK